MALILMFHFDGPGSCPLSPPHNSKDVLSKPFGLTQAAMPTVLLFTIIIKFLLCVCFVLLHGVAVYWPTQPNYHPIVFFVCNPLSGQDQLCFNAPHTLCHPYGTYKGPTSSPANLTSRSTYPFGYQHGDSHRRVGWGRGALRATPVLGAGLAPKICSIMLAHYLAVVDSFFAALPDMVFSPKEAARLVNTQLVPKLAFRMTAHCLAQDKIISIQNRIGPTIPGSPSCPGTPPPRHDLPPHRKEH